MLNKWLEYLYKNSYIIWKPKNNNKAKWNALKGLLKIKAVIHRLKNKKLRNHLIVTYLRKAHMKECY